MLDKKKPFGEVHGHAPYNFMQNDKFFDGQGNEVTETGKPVGKPVVKLVDGGAPVKDERTEKTEEIEQMTVDAIKLKLEAFGAEFDKKSVKADLVALLVDEELAE